MILDLLFSVHPEMALFALLGVLRGFPAAALKKRTLRILIWLKKDRLLKRVR